MDTDGVAIVPIAVAPAPLAGVIDANGNVPVVANTLLTPAGTALLGVLVASGYTPAEALAYILRLGGYLNTSTQTNTATSLKTSTTLAQSLSSTISGSNSFRGTASITISSVSSSATDSALALALALINGINAADLALLESGAQGYIWVTALTTIVTTQCNTYLTTTFNPECTCHKAGLVTVTQQLTITTECSSLVPAPVTTAASAFCASLKTVTVTATSVPCESARTHTPTPTLPVVYSSVGSGIRNQALGVELLGRTAGILLFTGVLILL